jgi:Kinesin motor domain
MYTIQSKEMKDQVLSYVRIRPINSLVSQEQGTASKKSAPEQVSHLVKSDERTICDSTKSYKFDRVFDDSTNLEIFDEVIHRNWDVLFQGINMSVFTYGQTSSGKTWTMKGDGGEQGKQPANGLIIHSLRGFFDDKRRPAGYSCQLKISYFEIYNEKINDLISKEQKNLEVRQGKNGIFVEGLSEHFVNTAEEAINLYILGERNRKYASTGMNDKSSRSHVILKV